MNKNNNNNNKNKKNTDFLKPKVNDKRTKGILPQLKPNDITRYLRHSLANINQPPIDISNSEQVQERVLWYFNHCIDNDMKPTINGLANSIGVDVRTILRWANGELRKDTHSPIIKKAYAIMQEMYENYMLNGKINPVTGIFIGKNHYHYKDTTDINVSTPQNDLPNVDLEEVKKKYLETKETMKTIENKQVKKP